MMIKKNMVLVSIFCREQVVGNSYNWLLKIVLCIRKCTVK